MNSDAQFTFAQGLIDLEAQAQAQATSPPSGRSRSSSEACLPGSFLAAEDDNECHDGEIILLMLLCAGLVVGGMFWYWNFQDEDLGMVSFLCGSYA